MGKHNISIKAGAGNDSINGSDGFLVYGEAGDDYIDLGNSVRAFGGTGNDCINMRNHAGVEGGDGDYDIDAYAHALVSGGEGNDAIWVHEYSYVYGGNAAIANYSGQKVKWASDYTGIGFNDNNFMINSSYGTLSLQNACDKVIDVSNTRGKSIVYVYISSGGGNIDGRGFSQLEVVLDRLNRHGKRRRRIISHIPAGRRL